MALQRISVLDGWRALSILLVMAGHLFPLGPKSWGMNGPIASTGMALFFTLSGFLIVQFLLDRPDVPEFLRRRIFRIVPLAWLSMAILAIANQPNLETVLANFLFVANLPPQRLMHGGGHLWSLCLEVQFYLLAAVLVAVGGRRSLYLLPLLCLCVTGLRIYVGRYGDIVTWYRADEILAGASLALIYSRRHALPWLARLPNVLPLLLLVLVVASAHHASGPLNYLRPYLAAGAIGASLFSAPEAMRRLFCSRPAVYIAQISYALYIVHGMLMDSWLGSGDTLVKYAKRPALLLVTFAAAHASTFHFEQRMIRLGKNLGRRPAAGSAAS